MATNIDIEIDKLARKYNQNGEEALKLLKRFLDDIFLIFCGSTKNLHTLLEDINKINPSIELTMTHTSIQNEDIENKCECETLSCIPFLDTLCSIKDGKVETELYRKETDRNQYLLPSSCHPKQKTRSIQFSLATRIIRICSSPDKREVELEKLRMLLLERNYKIENINSAIEKAKEIPRDQLLKKKTKTKTENRPVFSVEYDPRLPHIQPIQAKHWRSMSQGTST